MPEEVRFFIRTGGFGLTLAAVYWLVSYEMAGSVLLLGFGVAAAFLAIAFGLGARAAGRPITRRIWTWIGFDPQSGEPIARDPERYPASTATPLIAGTGVAIAALGLIYGPALVLAAAPLLLIGATRWIGAANREWRATAARDEARDRAHDSAMAAATRTAMAEGTAVAAAAAAKDERGIARR